MRHWLMTIGMLVSGFCVVSTFLSFDYFSQAEAQTGVHCADDAAQIETSSIAARPAAAAQAAWRQECGPERAQGGECLHRISAECEETRAAAIPAKISTVKPEKLSDLKTFRDCPDCPEMVVIPAGSFTMGSAAREAGRGLDEWPQRAVDLKRFGAGKYEVTFDEWDACVAAGGCAHRPQDSLGWGRGRRPVINVSWRDAQSYVRWLSQETGRRYRLLTEAEWEYAARAGSPAAYHTGDRISPDQANFRGAGGGYRGQTLEVGGFAANRWGLHDVHGNVREWVQDCWRASYERSFSDGAAWMQPVARRQGGRDCAAVLRGGSWRARPASLRLANRMRNERDQRNLMIGFRVAVSLER